MQIKKCNIKLASKMCELNGNSPLSRRQSHAKTEFASRTSIITKRSSVPSTCRICLSTIFDPAALTCGHKFCERCLHHYWCEEDKPEFIVCPLCRANAFNVDFAKKEDISSTNDFRKTFNTMENLNSMCQSDVNEGTLLFLKIGILMPFLYYVLKWFSLPLVQLLTLFHIKLTHNLI